MSGRPAVLFLAHRIPYPPDKGEKIRALNIVERLAERFDVHLAAFVDEPADFAGREALAARVASLSLFRLERRFAAVRSAAGFVSRQALTFPYFRDARMARRVAEIRASPLAAEIAFSSSMAPYIREGGRAARLVDLCDSDAEKWRQYAARAEWPLRAVYAREARRLAEAETAILNWADAAFAATRAEAAILNARPGVRRPAIVLANGVDTEHFRPNAERSAPERGGDVVFVGRMDYRANVDAVLHFARAVWPKVRMVRPARFAVVGAGPPREVRALDGADGVAVVGRVDDVRPYLQHAALAVAPLRIARGVQNKVLEAMAMARPVVASPAAAEGIDAAPGTELVVADGEDAFAAAILALLADRKRGDAIGASARARVKADYSWRARLAPLDAALDRLSGASDPERASGPASPG